MLLMMSMMMMVIVVPNPHFSSRVSTCRCTISKLSVESNVPDSVLLKPTSDMSGSLMFSSDDEIQPGRPHSPECEGHRPGAKMFHFAPACPGCDDEDDDIEPASDHVPECQRHRPDLHPTMKREHTDHCMLCQQALLNAAQSMQRKQIAEERDEVGHEHKRRRPRCRRTGTAEREFTRVEKLDVIVID